MHINPQETAKTNSWVLEEKTLQPTLVKSNSAIAIKKIFILRSLHKSNPSISFDTTFDILGFLLKKKELHFTNNDLYNRKETYIKSIARQSYKDKPSNY